MIIQEAAVEILGLLAQLGDTCEDYTRMAQVSDGLYPEKADLRDLAQECRGILDSCKLHEELNESRDEEELVCAHVDRVTHITVAEERLLNYKCAAHCGLMLSWCLIGLGWESPYQPMDKGEG